jgi:predicted metal-dependent enzyme (double-stranded beta helix superfamily)
MSYTLEQFAADCHEAIKADPGPAGREKVRQCVERALKDPEFVETHLGPDNDSQRKILYEDPDYKFCILAHVYKGAKGSSPHDHGPSWAIYGQAKGVTEMTEWRKIKAPSGDEPGVVEAEKVYDLKPGMAIVYQEGQLHSPRRENDTCLIRIEGQNLESVKRDRYVAAVAA